MKISTLKKQLLLLSLIITLLLSGCSSNKHTNSNIQNLPTWYLNAPNNSDTQLYGTGEATSLEESKHAALNNLASKLSVNISSVLNTYKNAITDEEGNTSFNKDISQDIEVEVEKMRFANYTVEKSTKIGNSFYTLVKINRSKLFEERYKEFDIQNQHISKKLTAISNKAILEQIQSLQNLYPQLTQAKKDAFILYTIQNHFNYSPFITQYDDSIDKINLLKEQIIIELSTNEPSRFFSNELLELLNKHHYKVSSQNSNTQIIVNNNTRYSIAKGWQIAKVTTTISTITNGKTISNTTINSVGRSTSSKENAQASAAQHFKKQLHELGLNPILLSN